MYVDDDFISKVIELYRRRVSRGVAVFDLCLSWVLYLLCEVEYEKVWGYGMNVMEFGRNERLDGFFVRDFNETLKIDAKDCSFDVVMMCVSV